jgi:hypothetical protein
VIIFDADFMDMSLLPMKGYAVLVIDPNAVAAGLIASKAFQPVARRNRQIFQPCRDVQSLQFPLRRTP